MVSNSNSIQIPKFDGTNYEYWSIKMMTLLEGKDLWDIVEDGYKELDDWIVLSEDTKK